MLKCSQGDQGTFKLQAWADKGKGLAFDLTGATYEGRINGADGSLQILDNDAFTTLSQAAQPPSPVNPAATGTRGQFLIAFTSAQSALWRLNGGEEYLPDELLVVATQGSGPSQTVVTFRADLVVERNIPRRSR